jgi:sulfite exporter TauE/SafE
MDLWVIFLTGLTTGGLTCLAVQGGLLATAVAGPAAVAPQASQRRYKPKGKRRHKKPAPTPAPPPNPVSVWPVVYFLVAKLIAYTLIGFALGSLGSAVQISPTVQAVMQIAVGLFMLVTALNMLEIHPIFRYFVIQPPKALTRLVRQQSKRESLFTPVFLGALTVLIPCGTTQAMGIFAISTGNALTGAVVMFIYTLGTSPTFLVLGFLATRLRGQFQYLFTIVTAGLIIILGLLSLNAGLNLVGSPLAPQRIIAALLNQRFNGTPVPAQMVDGVQEVTIRADGYGYSPDFMSAQTDQPLRLRLVTENTFACSRQFTIPSLGITRALPMTGETLIDLPPQPAGDLYFTCSMGMYDGIVRVTERKSA